MTAPPADLERALRPPAPAAAVVADAVRQAVGRADAEGLVDVAWSTVDTPIGPLLLAGTDAGVVKIGFGVDEGALEELAAGVSPRVVEAPARLDDARRQLDDYFAGRRRVFDLRLDWRLARGFRRTVLERLFAEVPFGATVSYLDLAARAGNPRASRAVGTAMATNPLPIVVPCHRVLRTGGALGGYGGGLDAKRRLLALEGALPVQEGLD
jgi:methylated-DNA-[protein]-cysteine S-methyltransferase